MGLLAKLTGPTATRTEILLQFIAPVAIVAFLVYSQAAFLFGQGLLYTIILCLLAFDVLGGVVTNETLAARKWFNRDDVSKLKKWLFCLMHLVHICVLFLYLNEPALPGLLTYGSLYLASFTLVILTPNYISRAVAASLYCGFIVLFFEFDYFGLENFKYLLLIFHYKIVVAYSVSFHELDPVNNR